jgi:hypothetical protein
VSDGTTVHHHPHPSVGAHAHTAGAGQGPVALEIGGDVGAIVLMATQAMEGAELDITPVGEDDRRSHVAVLSRPVGSNRVWAAVYPALPAGRYRIWDVAGVPTLEVEVRGGQVSEVTWPVG